MIHKRAYKHVGKRMIESPVTGSYLFANELLPQELAGLKHVGDVVEWTETFVFVLGLLLSRENGRWRSILGMGRGDEWKEGHGSRKLFTLHFQSCMASHIRCRCKRTNTHTHTKKATTATLPIQTHRFAHSRLVCSLFPLDRGPVTGRIWTRVNGGGTHKHRSHAHTQRQTLSIPIRRAHRGKKKKKM